MPCYTGDPTYKTVLAKCSQAVLNPDTDIPVDKKIVYDILRKKCYDQDPNKPWSFQNRLSKTSLSEPFREKRLAWGLAMQGRGLSDGWLNRNVVWVDLCNSILPLSEAKAQEQAMARKRKRGWISDDSKIFSPNLGGNKNTLRQNSWDTVRVWWAPVLTRGKLHVEILPAARLHY